MNGLRTLESGCEIYDLMAAPDLLSPSDIDAMTREIARLRLMVRNLLGASRAVLFAIESDYRDEADLARAIDALKNTTTRVLAETDQ